MLFEPLFTPPDFLIIGTQKGGTTSLYSYLCQHPGIAPAAQKEIHYFDAHYARGNRWYLRQFPSSIRRMLRGALDRSGHRALTGEATPFYLMHPLAAQRIAALAPQARLIMLLREPAARAYSQYQHNRRMGWETLDFDAAIDREEERIAPALDALSADPMHTDTRLPAYSYKARGRYLEQIERYERLFPREQMLVLSSEELFSNPGAVFDRTVAFLGLPQCPHPQFEASNAGGYGRELPSKIEQLRRYFAPFNEGLFHHLGTRFAWD